MGRKIMPKIKIPAEGFPATDRVSLSGRRPITPEDATPTPKRLPDGQYEDSWVLPPDLRKPPRFVRPLRLDYWHRKCGEPTTVAHEIAATFAADPHFYHTTFCSKCRSYFPLDQFRWYDDGDVVGS